MAASNLPILYQNIMFGLPTDYARDAFLWASDKFQDDAMAYKAEAFAREADTLFSQIGSLIDIAQTTRLRSGGMVMNEEQELDLLQYFQARFANWRIGGNVKSRMPSPR